MSINISSKPSLVDLFVKDLCLLLLLLSLLLEQLDQPGHLPLVVLNLGLGGEGGKRLFENIKP